ncbi:MAG: 50S ribosomal protein L29 [Saprospiraceae bacterium]|jgi:large subunit ribosomal protein L29|nr:50S ribosomal protein L29 [Saprospiraceae bacterium]MBL0024560.1 50S ribosomal protein L29 [Saprospiraceae bacterium]
MATKKFLELQTMSVETIEAELSQSKTDLNRMKFDHGAKGLENPLEIGILKRDIARLKTELRAREVKSMTDEQLAKRSNIRLRRK